MGMNFLEGKLYLGMNYPTTFATWLLEHESDVFGCCCGGAGVVEVPGIIGSWHANITKTKQRYFQDTQNRFDLSSACKIWSKVDIVTLGM